MNKVTVFVDEVNNHTRIEMDIDHEVIYEGILTYTEVEQIIDLLRATGFSVTEVGYTYE